MCFTTFGVRPASWSEAACALTPPRHAGAARSGRRSFRPAPPCR
jgi:hypothetical protein